MKADQAQEYALRAVEWAIIDDERQALFFGATGLNPEDLREAALTSDGLIAVMDFALSQDFLVLSLAEYLEIKPEEVVQVHASLPGNELPHWT